MISPMQRFDFKSDEIVDEVEIRLRIIFLYSSYISIQENFIFQF